VSQWWEGNIKKTASHLYALLVTSLSTKFLAGQMWLKSDKWQTRTQLKKAQQSAATLPLTIIHSTLQPCFLLLCFRLCTDSHCSWRTRLSASYAEANRDSSVVIVTGLRVGQPGKRSSTPGRCKICVSVVKTPIPPIRFIQTPVQCLTFRNRASYI
jgi:hypothetical protein